MGSKLVTAQSSFIWRVEAVLPLLGRAAHAIVAGKRHGPVAISAGPSVTAPQRARELLALPPVVPASSVEAQPTRPTPVHFAASASKSVSSDRGTASPG